MTRINKCHLDEALVLPQVIVFQDTEASAAARTVTRRNSAAAEGPRTAISVEQT